MLRLLRIVVCCALSLLGGIIEPAPASEIAVEHADPVEPIKIAADQCSRWQQGAYEVYHLRGNCFLNQGLTYARGPEAVLWIEHSTMPGQPTKVIAYFEDQGGQGVVVDYQDEGNAGAQSFGRQKTSHWFQRFYSVAPLKLKVPEPALAPDPRPAIYDRGLAQFNPKRQQQIALAQFTEFAPAPTVMQGLPLGMRSIQYGGRSDVLPDVLSQELPAGGRVTTVTGGLRVLIEGLPTDNVPAAFGPIGTVDISTDRAVVWSQGALAFGGQTVESSETPLEIYMEGNIEFRQGDRVVYADRMFYDVRRQVGVILNAELLTPLPKTEDFEYQGLVRLRASAIRQLDASHFSATGAEVTTSRLEEPAYSFGANQITFEDVQTQTFNPLTGEPEIDHKYLAESRGNAVYIRGVPTFYWPRLATDLSKPSFFIDNVRLGNDNIFGTQVLTDLDAYQLFGIRNAPEGTEWGLSLDYLSDRGLGHGTNFEYNRQSFLGLDGPAQGLIDFWGIADDGLDNLGLGRRAIVPEEDYRFRLFSRHRQKLQSGWDITGEAGWISDRTFLEQYYEQEWDEYKDPRNGLRLKRLTDNRALSIEGNVQQNDFFTETQWLPRLDHYWLGESLFGDRFTWYEHSQIAYANLNNADAPTNATLAAQVDAGLPWEIGPGQEGERIVTRQEIDLPLSVGPVKVVPFALGELAHWGEDAGFGDLQRAYVNTGVRASVPFWAVFPDFRDSLFNLHGLAHKVVFDAEFSYSDANRNFDELPLYDPLDDMSITEFRRRLFDPTLTPTSMDPKFLPTNYAIRSGLQNWVTSPSTEMVDDLMTLRGGMRHRWQTKRGGPGREHIVDWLDPRFECHLVPRSGSR